MTYRAVVLLLIVGAFPIAARAELPQPYLERIFPLGGKAGSIFSLEIGGRDIDDVKILRFDHPGLKAEFVKKDDSKHEFKGVHLVRRHGLRFLGVFYPPCESLNQKSPCFSTSCRRTKCTQFKVTVAADVPEGTYEVRAVGKWGISGSRLLAIQQGLTEVAEVEPNDSPDKAQTVPMNCAVNGKSDANGDDYFVFPAKAGQRVTIDCQAFRLDSQLKARLALLTPDGMQLAFGKPYHGRTDPLIDFVAPAEGKYVIRVHDVVFNGDQPYRLVISNRPQLEYAFPPVVRAGETTELQIVGRNLPGGQPTDAGVAGAAVLEQLRLPFTAPAESAGYSFIQHIPSARLLTRGLQVRPGSVANALNPLNLVTTSLPLTWEREPNNTPGSAQPVALPTVICGRFDRPDDVDWYRFTAKAGETVAVDLVCDRLGVPSDPYVVIANSKGEELATLDDFGQNDDSGLNQANRDPVGTFAVPADGEYFLRVQDRYRQGGARFVYALRVGKPEPDFFPVAYHEGQNDPLSPVLRQGGTAFLCVCVNRRDGFDVPVTVEAEGLPRGVTCPPLVFHPQQEILALVFQAAADAPEWTGSIRLKAWGVKDGKKIERPVAGSQRRWGDGNQNNTCRANRQNLLAVRPMKAPYLLTVPTAVLKVTAGKAVEFPVGLARHWPDFREKMQLNGFKLPNGFEMTAEEIPLDKKEGKVKLQIGGDVPPGVYSVVLRGEAQIPFNADPKAADKPNTRVADPAPAVKVEVTAPPK